MSHPERLGKYQITEVLGKGAMGVVYKAFDPDIQRTVAIKTIRRELIEDDDRAGMLLARFKNEARAAGRLSHPGIVAVYDYGEAGELAFIAMEFVQGNSLRAYFGRETRFEERDIVSLMAQLLDALQHAHEQGVWHRDIKPANLIIMNSGKLKVADFGIARIDSSALTHTGAVMGSPGYMAPEQYKGETVDWRADIFAAGVVLHQLLTGARPFTGSTEQLVYRVCYESPAAPSEAAPGREWERYDPVVARALNKRPEDRFERAAAFKAAILEAYAAPVSPTISEETIILESARPAGLLEPSHPSWQTDRSGSGTPTPAPRTISHEPTLTARSVPPGTASSASHWDAERTGGMHATPAVTQPPPSGTLPPPATRTNLAWALGGAAVVLVLIGAGLAGWLARGTQEADAPLAGPAPVERPSVASDSSARAGREAEAKRVDEERARAERASADARARADREAAQAKRAADDRARAEREAAEAKRSAEARARAEREAAEARSAAEARARAEAQRARTQAAASRAPAQAAPDAEAARAHEAQLAADARARAEADRARAQAETQPASAAAQPQAPAREANFFRDEATTMKVATKLQFNRALLREQIQVRTVGGVVTLSGSVSTQANRELAGKLAGEVSGVARVNNTLRIGAPEHVSTPGQ